MLRRSRTPGATALGAAALVMGVALFAAVFALRPSNPSPAEAILVLCVTSLSVIVGRFAAERRRLARQVERIFDVAVDLHCIAGFDGYFTRVNRAGCALLGYSEEELTGRPFIEFVHPDDRDRTREEVSRISGDRSTVDFENRYRTADGSYRWLAWRTIVIDQMIYASARDVTGEKDHRAELAQLVAGRTRDLQAARFENLRRLALAAEYRDDDTHKHTERVGELAALLAECLGSDRDFVEMLRHAAPLHDVGKLGLPDSILLKPGRLTDDERLAMQKHTAIGAKILTGSGFPVLKLGEQIALTHHERWDGHGYPRGLAAEATPLAGRIVAVADVFDALTHERPYKPAWPLADAVAEIVAGSGSQFDPHVVAALRDLHGQRALDRFVGPVASATRADDGVISPPSLEQLSTPRSAA